jgi:hypothetical protein
MKDPLDNGRTVEIPFDAAAEHEKNSFSLSELAEQVCPPEPIAAGAEVEIFGTTNPGKYVVVEPVQEEEPAEFTPMADEKVAAALSEIRGRSFSGRNPHLGKMIKCQVCGQRHRATAKRESENSPVVYVTDCVQKFTSTVNGQEVFRESEKKDKNGNVETVLVPDLRTAIDPDLTPTIKQIVGAPLSHNFSKPRKHRHVSASDLQLIERTRKVFAEMGFTITEGEQARKNMEIARKEARHQLHREDRKRARKVRKQQKRSRQINGGR